MNDDKTEMDYLLELWSRCVCPWCEGAIAEGTRVGSGRPQDGGFCSLECYARYHASELRERARRVASVVHKRQQTPH
jgi:hypothetical protein